MAVFHVRFQFLKSDRIRGNIHFILFTRTNNIALTSRILSNVLPRTLALSYILLCQFIHFKLPLAPTLVHHQDRREFPSIYRIYCSLIIIFPGSEATEDQKKKKKTKSFFLNPERPEISSIIPLVIASASASHKNMLHVNEVEPATKGTRQLRIE